MAKTFDDMLLEGHEFTEGEQFIQSGETVVGEIVDARRHKSKKGNTCLRILVSAGAVNCSDYLFPGNATWNAFIKALGGKVSFGKPNADNVFENLLGYQIGITVEVEEGLKGPLYNISAYMPADEVDG